MTNTKLLSTGLLALAMALPAAQAPAATMSPVRAIFDVAGPGDTDLVVTVKQGRSGTGERGRDRDRSGDDSGRGRGRGSDDGPSHERHGGNDDGPSHERHGDDDGPSHERHSGNDDGPSHERHDDDGFHHEVEVHVSGSGQSRGRAVWGPGCDGSGDNGC